MIEALSQDEIDDLLNTISNGDDVGSSDPNIVHAGPRGRIDRRKVRVYDFKRPSKFSKEQMRTVSMMHETFARLTTTSMSAQLRSIVNVHVVAVDELTYDEFIRSLSSPTTTAVISMDPLKGSAILELDPSITFALLDRLLGGQGVTLNKNRELTEIESSVAEMIVVRILGNLRESWSQILDLRPRLSHIETNPQFVQIVPPGEMVVLITLETRIEKIEGIMNLCIPYVTLEPIISQLSSQFWYSSSSRQTSSESLKLMEDRIERVNINLAAEIGNTTLTMRELLSIQVDDVLQLREASIAKPISLKINNQYKYNCRPGMSGSKVAVQVIDKVLDVNEIDVDEIILTGGDDEL